MGDRQKRAGKPETCSLGVSGLVAEIAGDLLPRHIEGLPHNLERFRSIGGVLNQRIADATALD